MNSKKKTSNSSSFVILTFAILEFRNIGHYTFGSSKFWPPPEKIQKYSFHFSVIFLFKFFRILFSIVCQAIFFLVFLSINNIFIDNWRAKFSLKIPSADTLGYANPGRFLNFRYLHDCSFGFLYQIIFFLFSPTVF